MVTHNPELAQTYSTRIIRLLDGKILSDSMPVRDDETITLEGAEYNFEPGLWNEETAAEPIVEIEIKDDDLTPELEKLIPVEQTINETQKSTKELKRLYKLEVKKAEKEEKAEQKAKKKAEKDSNYYDRKAEKEQKKAEKKILKAHRASKKSMKFFTALSLSFTNLLTKKGRTFLTSFAGSIGIIGIALILSISNGVQIYIDKVQEDTLSSYPISIEKQTLNVANFMTIMSGGDDSKEEHELDRIYTNSIMTEFIDTMMKEVSVNNLAEFKKYIENNRSKFDGLVSDIQYNYSTKLNVFRADTQNGIFRVTPSAVFEKLGMKGMGGSMAGMGGYDSDVWTRLLDNDELLESQYEVIAGKFPKNKDEVVLIVNDENEVVDYTLYSLGMMDCDALSESFNALLRGEEDVAFPEPRNLEYDEVLSLEFRLFENSAIYAKEKGKWVDKSSDVVYMKNVIDNGLLIKVVGIIRPKSDAAVSSSLNGRIGYRTSLMDYLIEKNNESDPVIEQKSKPDFDIINGIPFDDGTLISTITSSMESFNAYLSTLPEEQRMQSTQSIGELQKQGMNEEDMMPIIKDMLTATLSGATYEDNLKKLGVSDPDEPSVINIFPVDFESKDKIAEIIKEYNSTLPEDERITYTDYVGLIMSSVTTIIDVISYILISFVAISLVVSSVMIGIITNISVLERTKEIGILRAVGASKRDIARVFNAETLMIGFAAGALGILITKLLLIPINSIIYHFTDIADIAKLPNIAALILVGISMLLTFTAGIFPAMRAARKDPVEALRSE
ncbi:MAG: FtsX-like permease family protein [Lachnospiraceae bacterium]|nr:FtsX-like permease family protein [Lachnospiraceae bacterium]